MCGVFASMKGCVQVCTGVCGYAWVCEDMRGRLYLLGIFRISS